jgi:hypothetical protein
MKYAVELGSDAVIYMPSFIKINSAIQKLIGGGGWYTDTQHGDRISLLKVWPCNKLNFERSEVDLTFLLSCIQDATYVYLYLSVCLSVCLPACLPLSVWSGVRLESTWYFSH